MVGVRMVSMLFSWRSKNTYFGADMKKQFVYDPLISKRQQYLLATQVCYKPGELDKAISDPRLISSLCELYSK